MIVLLFLPCILKRLKKGADIVINIEFDVHAEVEYLSRLNACKSSLGGKCIGHKETHLVLRDGAYVGDYKDLIAIAKQEFRNEEASVANSLIFNKQAKEEVAKLLNDKDRQYVFLDFIDGSPKRTKNAPEYGKVIIEL